MPKREQACPICGKKFLAYECQKRTYCSRACKHEGHKKQVVFTCDFCGKEFSIPQCYAKRKRKKRYCSQECRDKDRFKRKVRQCAVCGQSFRPPRDDSVYCSKKCFGKTRRDKIDLTCDFCGNQYTVKRSRVKKSNYCSVACRASAYSRDFSGKNSPQWRGGASFAPYTDEFDKKLKLSIRQRDDFTCQVCGLNEEEHNTALHIHHIDYDKTNNSPSNLISLCMYCHTVTNYERRFWQDSLYEIITTGN